MPVETFAVMPLYIFELKLRLLTLETEIYLD